MTRVLLVDDEPHFLRALTVTLNARGYDVDVASSGEDALRRAANGHPDAVLLDRGFPGMDGLAVVQGLRGCSDVPIVILSARDAESAKVAALDAGDYVTKPFSINELFARLRAALRRRHRIGDAAVVRTPDFTIDLAAAKAWRCGEEIHLTPTEWKLVTHLVRNPGRLITQRWLLSQVGGPEYSSETNYLRVYVAGLRRKLERNPSQPRYFITEPGTGYRFEPGDDDGTEISAPDPLSNSPQPRAMGGTATARGPSTSSG